ncbi:MAG TPA: glycerol-3-phosphate 1-O-acyltransferase PlsY [Gaiellaceae bacterium]|nr:glycerol-3-phosphate 1-O-acyltransferase PlsY [Gaiellaceae bacterium]
MTDTLVLIAVGYLVGSMPWGYWLVRVFRGEDIRQRGSGNIGASNVWRVYGSKLGVPVLLLDVAKGFVPALIAAHAVGYLAAALAGGAAMLGHYRPLFLGFQRGGKVVATGGGAFLGMAPLAALAGLAVWIVVFVVTRYPSVASMVTAVSLVAWSLLFGYPWPVTTFAALTAVAVILLHRANIRRLLHGQENRSTLWRRWWRKDGATPSASL